MMCSSFSPIVNVEFGCLGIENGIKRFKISDNQVKDSHTMIKYSSKWSTSQRTKQDYRYTFTKILLIFVTQLHYIIFKE